MHPYIAWAKRYRWTKSPKGNVSPGLVGWYLRVYEGISNRLVTNLDNTLRFDEFKRAQLFLGYLASFTKPDNKESESNPEDSSIALKEDGRNE
jgi:hypothetical protein